MALNMRSVFPVLPGNFTLGCPKSTDMLSRLSSGSIDSYLGFFSTTSSPSMSFGMRRIAYKTGSMTCFTFSSSPCSPAASLFE
eukprot:UN4422